MIGSVIVPALAARVSHVVDADALAIVLISSVVVFVIGLVGVIAERVARARQGAD